MSGNASCQCFITGTCTCTASGCFCSHGHDIPNNNTNFHHLEHVYDRPQALAYFARHKSDSAGATRKEVSDIDDKLSADGGRSVDSNHFDETNDVDAPGEGTPLQDVVTPAVPVATGSCCGGDKKETVPTK
ncbi:hypothetical protein TWF696_005085 [Orbilia brochopaga]|uniref:Metallothionein n=1 Tax=Orbilia brochopaga TaxID=3140254 RepID=A0AAV9V1Z2_9PEZI